MTWDSDEMRINERSPLSPLLQLDHPIADLLQSFLSESADWKVDSYFEQRAHAFFDDPDLIEQKALSLDSVNLNRQRDSAAEVRLVSLRVNYFRGFREQESAVDLSGDLVVIDGPNSTGKTSLAEAIEWLLTGSLARRDQLDAKELADCICNRFKPDDEETWVEGVFKTCSKTLVYRRILTKDYGTTRTSECDSRLILNNEKINDSDRLIDDLFSGVAPLLMQHTLQQFVIASPSKRRDYFEHLLNLDDISTAIEKAVVGETGSGNFPRPGGTNTIKMWRELLEALGRTEELLLTNNAVSEPSQLSNAIISALLRIAVENFDVMQSEDLESAIESLKLIQRQTRQSRFPLLEHFRPKRALDEALLSRLSVTEAEKKKQSLLDSWSNVNIVEESHKTLSEGQAAISSALDSLRRAGLLEDVDVQVCPLCDYEQLPTLSSTRISEISDWIVVRDALAKAKGEFSTSKLEMENYIKQLQTMRSELIPAEASRSDWETVDATQYRQKLEDLKNTHASVNIEMKQFDHCCSLILTGLKSERLTEGTLQYIDQFFTLIPQLVIQAKDFAGGFKDFEDHLSSLSGDDQMYAARDNWLCVADQYNALLADIRWEHAKISARRELETIRKSLIQYRQEYLNERRNDFSSDMSKIWSKLRKDRYSRFDRLVIPKPRGKGFPVRVELQAKLDSNGQVYEVDALSVLSESQLNVIGISAFITRSKLSGHTILIMDDPVQSMDDDHFKTFANGLVNYLCDEGFQVIVLTHNDKFARDVSNSNYDRNGYVTLEIRHSRREGVRITEGNRRVAERLKLAEDFTDEGKLRDAWRTVRLAIERLYLVAYIKHGPKDFDPRTWANQGAEFMWCAGVAEIIKCHSPDSITRLKEILNMTASGAHDKASEGETVLREAIMDLRPLLSKLKIGG